MRQAVGSGLELGVRKPLGARLHGERVAVYTSGPTFEVMV
jgi:hypothetical protein